MVSKRRVREAQRTRRAAAVMGDLVIGAWVCTVGPAVVVLTVGAAVFCILVGDLVLTVGVFVVYTIGHRVVGDIVSVVVVRAIVVP
jgi:hypothetical protein